MRKFSFSTRIRLIPIWNSLPDYVVASPTTNTFKARLDKFWEKQDVRYSWKADILFTGSRSKVELTILILLCDWNLFRTMDWTQRSTTCVQLIYATTTTPSMNAFRNTVYTFANKKCRS